MTECRVQTSAEIGHLDGVVGDDVLEPLCADAEAGDVRHEVPHPLPSDREARGWERPELRIDEARGWDDHRKGKIHDGCKWAVGRFKLHSGRGVYRTNPPPPPK